MRRALADVLYVCRAPAPRRGPSLPCENPRVFSRRIPEDLRPNRLAQLRARAGEIPYDLTVTNPTVCDLPYPEDILAPLAQPAGSIYRPEPLGLAAAREAVAEAYGRAGIRIAPRQVAIVSSTSEAYGLLFKLLCDPGDEVLIPRPSYPLLEHLVTLEGARPVTYRLDPASGWQPRPEELASPRARAVVVVHPNNPTGSYLDEWHRQDLLERCRASRLALVADEVFHAFPLAGGPVPRSFAGTGDVLTFAIGGLSKYAGLPQVKLSWIVASGPEPEAREALDRLEFAADQYLSVSTPVQLALPRLLSQGAGIRAAILERCRRNLETLASAARAVPGVEVPLPRAGWSALVRFPGVIREETLVVQLLAEDGVAVHPGYFFDFPQEGWLVVSLLAEPSRFAEGCRRLLARIARSSSA